MKEKRTVKRGTQVASIDERLLKKVKISEEFYIMRTKINIDYLDELWDKDGVYHEERVKDVITKIKNHQERSKFTKRKTANEVANEVRDMGLTDEEFNIGEVETYKKGRRESVIQITFRLKGNKKIIDYLESKGWVIDRRYKNEDGDPSIWASDIHGKNMYHKVVMIVMKYILTKE